MADIKWSAFPSTTSTASGDTVVGLHSGVNERFLVSAVPSASGLVLWDTNKNITANSFIPGYTTTATAAATTTLTIASTQLQYFTGITTQTVLLPVASTMQLGQSYTIVNNSTGVVSVESSGTNLVEAMASQTQLVVTCVLASGTTAASWDTDYTENILPVPLSEGGTSATLTASNGGIFYSNASTGAILAGTATSSLPLLSGSSASPTWGAFPLSLGGALTTAGALTTSGAFGSTFTFTNTTAVTFPTSGTLATTSQISLFWAPNASTSITAAVGNGYILTGSSLQTLTLPTVFVVGTMIGIQGQGSSGWLANLGASTNIIFCGVTYGTSVASTNPTDGIILTCIVANTTWAMTILSSTGLTIS